MRAAVYHGREDIRIEDVAEPSPGSGQVKLRVVSNGICGTDLHEFYNGPMFIGSDTPHPLTGRTLPQIIGHEFAGTVVELGEGVTDLALGDLVTVEPIEWCGVCPQCISGSYNLCPVLAFHGVQRDGGGLSEFTIVNRRMAHRVPEGVSAELAVLCEPMCVAFHGVLRSGLQPGQTGVVYGAGPIGIGAFLGLRAEGVTDLIVVEPSPVRRAAVERLGAPIVLDPTSDDVAGAILSHTKGRGADGSIDCAGATGSFQAAVASTGVHGRIVTVAVFAEPVPFSPNDILFRETQITASMCYCNDYPKVLAHMANGAYPLDGWVQHIALDDLVEHGIKVLRDQRAMKILVDVNP